MTAGTDGTMWSLYRTLSVRYVSRRWLRAGLITLSIALGVATLVATQSLNWTMARAAVLAANPTSGFADLIVSNGDLPIARSLETELQQVSGVADVSPRIFGNAFAPQLDDRQVVVIGVDAVKLLEKKGITTGVEVSDATKANFIKMAAASKLARLPFIGGLGLFGDSPGSVAGRELYDHLPGDKAVLKLRRGKAIAAKEFGLAGPVDASGDTAYFAGYIVVMDLADAANLFDLKDNFVNRFDITLAPNADPIRARADIEKLINGRGQVSTFAEQSQNTQSVISGLQTGFSLCGLAALVVGLFLVYNALSVTVTERRHEIGILRSLGSTRSQVLSLFAGEAITLGFLGSLIGIPMGIGLAQLGLRPMQNVLSDIFFSVDAKEVHVSWTLYGIALVVGTLTTLFASILPAFLATREKPADAVRKVLKAASMQNLLIHIAVSLLLVAFGTAMILGRDYLPIRWGTLGGMCVVLVGGLLASPFVSGILARIIQPFVRRFLNIEWRLAADNIVRSPGRTGLVIGALGAGVSLVVQTGGVICSNREAVFGWLEDSIAADLIVTSGSPVGAGGQTQPIPDSLVREIANKIGVEGVLPIRIRKIQFDNAQIMLLAYDPGQIYRAEKPRQKKVRDIELYRAMDETPGSAIVSANLAALHKIRVGDSIALPGPQGEVRFKVLGTIDDYSWTGGTLFVHRRDYVKNWNDTYADVIDVYLKPDADPNGIRDKLSAEYGLFALTRPDLKKHIGSMVEKIYNVAYAQLFVVMIVAGLGVVTALLISVLQRRHEMGLLRAVGASRAQVIRSVLAEACLMGVIGTLIGIVVGVPLEWYVLHVVILEDSGLLFPIVLPWKEAILVSGGALLTAIIAGLGPAIYAVRQRIPDAIAYE